MSTLLVSWRFRRVLISLTLGILALCCFPIRFDSMAQAQGVDEGRIVYVRELESGSYAVSYETGQATPIYGGRCSMFSPHLDYLARFDRNIPDQLSIFDLDVGTLAIQIPWQSTWIPELTGQPCFLTYWLDNDTFVIPSAQDANQVYHVDRTMEAISGPITLPPEIESTPLLTPKSGVSPTFSPSGNLVVYDRCEQPDCHGNTYTVLYDIPNQEIIHDLSGHGLYTLGSVITPGEEIYSWSHDEHYFVHDSTVSVLAVYDLNSRSYLDLSFLPQNFTYLHNRPGGWKWSPDNRQIAFAAEDAESLGYSFDYAIVIVDIVARTTRLYDVPYESLPRSFDVLAWTPAGDGLLMANKEGQMIRLDVADGSITDVTNHVYTILAWYPSVADW